MSLNNGNTVVSLKEYLEAQIDSLELRIGAIDRLYHELAKEKDKAIDAALAQYEKRMDTTNEWREAMKDREKLFVTKDQANSQFKGLAMAIAAIAALIAVIQYFN